MSPAQTRGTWPCWYLCLSPPWPFSRLLPLLVSHSASPQSAPLLSCGGEGVLTAPMQPVCCAGSGIAAYGPMGIPFLAAERRVLQIPVPKMSQSSHNASVGKPRTRAVNSWPSLRVRPDLEVVSHNGFIEIRLSSLSCGTCAVGESVPQSVPSLPRWTWKPSSLSPTATCRSWVLRRMVPGSRFWPPSPS